MWRVLRDWLYRLSRALYQASSRRFKILVSILERRWLHWLRKFGDRRVAFLILILLWRFRHIKKYFMLFHWLIANLTLGSNLLLFLRKLIHITGLDIQRRYIGNGQELCLYLWLNLRCLWLLFLNLYFFYLLTFTRRLWCCNSLRWNCAIRPLLLLHRRWSLLLTTPSTLPSFNRRSCTFRLVEDFLGLHWAWTRLEMVIDAFFNNFRLTKLHFLDWRIGYNGRRQMNAFIIGLLLRMRHHFGAFECLNGFNSSLRRILKNLKGLDLLLAFLLWEDLATYVWAFKYFILVVVNGQKLMFFLLVFACNNKRLLLLDDFWVFIAWISGNSLLLLIVCLYDIFLHFSINGSYCLSNFTVNLLMASRAASERICGECRRLYTLLDHYLFLIFFLLRYPLFNLLLRQLLNLLFS